MKFSRVLQTLCVGDFFRAENHDFNFLTFGLAKQFQNLPVFAELWQIGTEHAV